MPIEVHLSQLAVKQIQKVPRIIKEAILRWIDSVERFGLNETKRLGGKGRSVFLNRSWRLYYIERKNKITLVKVTRFRND